MATPPQPRIGVMGCKPAMPDAFPLAMRENSGNMIHGKAPFEMFPDTVFYTDARFGPGKRSFHQYLDSECSHVVITMANTLRVGRPDGEAYARFRAFLEKCRVPIVIFGLGAQSAAQEFPADGLPPEAIEMLKYLGDHTESIGVRGQYTADVIEHYAGVTNTFATGCPSFFSRPTAFDALAASLSENRKGRPAFNATKLKDPDERQLIARAITEDLHWIEATNPRITAYADGLQRGSANLSLPSELRYLLERRTVSPKQMAEYFARRFRLFRETSSWYDFNTKCVGFTFGTRFHGNMASLLSGVPALWVTHDSRTEEFTDYLRLPAVTKQSAAELSIDELRASMDYSAMYAALPELFNRFNTYLTTHGLPAVPLPQVVAHPPETTSLEPLPPLPSRGRILIRQARRRTRTAIQRLRSPRREHPRQPRKGK